VLAWLARRARGIDRITGVILLLLALRVVQLQAQRSDFFFCNQSFCILHRGWYTARLSRSRLVRRPCYGSSAGPPATINRESGQARKGAATAVDSCAGMWLVELPPDISSI